MSYDPIADEMEHQERHRMQQMMEKASEDRIQAEEERLRMMGIVDISDK